MACYSVMQAGCVWQSSCQVPDRFPLSLEWLSGCSEEGACEVRERVGPSTSLALSGKGDDMAVSRDLTGDTIGIL